jgi:hypothetical protein
MASSLWECYNKHISHIIAFLRYIDHYSYPSCRTRRPLPAECRPKFISVALWGARFRECSTPSTRFNLCENCYNVLPWRLLSSAQGVINDDAPGNR